MNQGIQPKTKPTKSTMRPTPVHLRPVTSLLFLWVKRGVLLLQARAGRKGCGDDSRETARDTARSVTPGKRRGTGHDGRTDDDTPGAWEHRPHAVTPSRSHASSGHYGALRPGWDWVPFLRVKRCHGVFRTCGGDHLDGTGLENRARRPWGESRPGRAERGRIRVGRA